MNDLSRFFPTYPFFQQEEDGGAGLLTSRSNAEQSAALAASPSFRGCLEAFSRSFWAIRRRMASSSPSYARAQAFRTESVNGLAWLKLKGIEGSDVSGSVT